MIVFFGTKANWLRQRQTEDQRLLGACPDSLLLVQVRTTVDLDVTSSSFRVEKISSIPSKSLLLNGLRGTVFETKSFVYRYRYRPRVFSEQG